MRDDYDSVDIAENTSSFMKEMCHMSAIKRWFEDHISDFTDEVLLDYGYEQEEIDSMRECFTPKEES